MREAREAIRAVVREAQQAGSARAAETARAALDETARAALAALPGARAAPSRPPAPALQPGARVFVPSLSAEGRVLHAPDARGRVKVAVGALTLDVDVAELGGAAKRAGGAAGASARARAVVAASARGVVAQARPRGRARAHAIRTPRNTLDLRGHRADDVEDAVVEPISIAPRSRAARRSS